MAMRRKNDVQYLKHNSNDIEIYDRGQELTICCRPYFELCCKHTMHDYFFTLNRSLKFDLAALIELMKYMAYKFNFGEKFEIL